MVRERIQQLTGGDYRGRRAMLTYAIIVFCLASILLLALLTSSEVAKAAIGAFESICQVSLVSYLGISAVDRSGIFANIAGRKIPNDDISVEQLPPTRGKIVPHSSEDR